MSTVFFTLISDDYYEGEGTPKFINSFKRFHPEIDLVVFRQDSIDSVFAETGINFFTAKPTFAKILAPYYDLVVNIDADHVVLDRLDEILKGDYDVAAPWNFNSYENRHFTTDEGKEITDEMYIQGGLVASTSKDFWDEYEQMNKQAHKYLCAENDILNIVWYGGKYKTKILDKGNLYYGCKLLGKEKECYLKDGKVFHGESQVKLYHHAKGRVFPKLDFHAIGFPKEVADHMQTLSVYGKSVRYGPL